MAFLAEEKQIENFLSQKVLSIPRNQRKYVWNAVNWKDLLGDLEFIVECNHNGEERTHFLGSVVLQRESKAEGTEKYIIIDGQQRTITFITFLCAAIMVLHNNGEEAIANLLVNKLVFLDRRNNEHHILSSADRIVITNILDCIKEIEGRNLAALRKILTKSDTNSPIYKSLEFFHNELNDMVPEKGTEYVIDVKDALLDSKYVQIVADTEEDSYTIFEILNARGQALEDHELIKNYIMRYISPKDEVDKAKTRWRVIEDNLGSNIGDFFRHYVIHMTGRSSENRYRALQEHFSKDKANEFLKDLEDKSVIYRKIAAPEYHKEFSPLETEEFNILSFLKSHRSRQLRPIIISLMSAHDRGKITDKDYLSMMRFIQTFYVCFSIVTGETSNRLTDIIDKSAPAIEADCKPEMIANLKKSLKDSLPDLDSFIKIFSQLGYSNHNKAYRDSSKRLKSTAVLNLVECQVNPEVIHGSATIEHLRPDSDGGTNWCIGNLTLLDSKSNGALKDKPLKEKIPYYKKSGYAITRNFAERYSEGDFDPMKRAAYMAKLIYSCFLKV